MKPPRPVAPSECTTLKIQHLFTHCLVPGLPIEGAVVETIGGKPMVRFRSNVMSIFVASALVLFVSPVKNAFAHPDSPAVAKAFSAQGQLEDAHEDVAPAPPAA